jgi:hypothetical protein
MSNALTGGFDAVLEVRRKTIRRFLAAMHEHGGDAAQDDLPRLPHNMVFRVGDETAVGGVRGKVQAQLGVPRIEPVMGAEIGPAAVGKVVVVYPVRAWFRPDPGTTPLPPFIHGDLHATFRVTLEAQPGGATLRFTPGDAAEFSFLSAGLSPAAAGQVAQQARHFLQGWSAKQPFLAVLGALDFPVRAKGVGETVAVPLPLPGGQPPPANLGGVTQDFTLVPAGGPADFAVAVSREYVLGLVQSFLDQVKASHPTFKVDPPWPLPDSTYTVHVHKAVADWKPAGSSVTIKLTFEGDATTPTILPNADWSVDLAFVVSFDDVAKTLVLAAAGDPVVSVDVHGPAGGLVEGDARARVEAEVKKQRAAALPAIQTAAGGVLPAQIARLTGLLHALVSPLRGGWRRSVRRHRHGAPQSRGAGEDRRAGGRQRLLRVRQLASGRMDHVLPVAVDLVADRPRDGQADHRGPARSAGNPRLAPRGEDPRRPLRAAAGAGSEAPGPGRRGGGGRRLPSVVALPVRPGDPGRPRHG